MWQAHWRLRHDPFLGASPTYVPTRAHDEAVARLSYGIENPGWLTMIRGGGGVGKSLVLRKAIVASRTPLRRFAMVDQPVETSDLLRAIATAVGGGRRLGSPRSPWSAFHDAIRLARVQGLHLVLVIDDADPYLEHTEGNDLDRLVGTTTSRTMGLSVLLSTRGGAGRFRSQRWLGTELPPLRFSETVAYLDTKLAAAGRSDSVFEPSAQIELQDRTLGVPAAIDRLASLALMAGALRGLDRVGRRIVEGVAEEFDPDGTHLPATLRD